MPIKRFLFLILVLVILIPVQGKQIIPLPGVVKPFRINVDRDRIYIGDGPVIFIFSRQDGKLITQFGKAGEGPAEFKLFPEFSPELDIQSDGILASSLGRISFFSRQGEFKWEKKSPGYVLENFNRLWGDKIVGQRVERDEETRFLAVKLYDREFGNEKEFHRHKYYRQQGKFNPIQRGIYISNMYIQGNEIFVGGAVDSGSIHVYDQNGKKLREIKPPLDKVPFTGKDRQGWIDSYMSNDEYKQIYERQKKWFDYSEFFPLFQNFIVDDNRIYFQTYKRNEKDGTNEVVMTDTNGNPIKKLWVPLVELWDFSPNPYTIKDVLLFQFVENENTEEWELHIIPIA